MLRFAVAGSPLSTPGSGGTLKGLVRAHELGIRAMELEWVQSVPKNPAHMAEIRRVAEELDITLTVHAPYFINLNTREPEKLAASKVRILAALRMAQLAGATSVCVHAAFNQGAAPADVLARVMDATHEMLRTKSSDFPDVNLAYETMGKHTQFGTLDEVLAVSREFELYPCVDFAHLHARANGALNSAAEWDALLDTYAAALGPRSLQRMHIHYSGIEYTDKGERRHLPFPDSDARWRDLLAVLRARKVGGTLVVESPLLEEETLLLSSNYER